MNINFVHLEMVNWKSFCLVSIPAIVLMFSAWYFRVENAYAEYAAKVDTFFANCPTDPPQDNATLGIVIPFPNKHEWKLFALFFIWSLDIFYPLNHNGTDPLTDRTYLILYPTYKDDEISNKLRQFLNEYPKVENMINKTFKSVQIIPRNMDKRYDIFKRDQKHGQWIASGVTEMFYPMMTKIAPELGLNFVLYYESDLFPLRSGWLTAIRNEIFSPDSDFWFYGSQQRQKRILGGRIHGHMNGNCIIRVDNKCARNFLQRVYKTYRYLPYDTSIMRYLLKQQNIREAQHILRRMRYSDSIANFYYEDVTREDLMLTYPELYLVHGNGYHKAINEILVNYKFRTGEIKL